MGYAVLSEKLAETNWSRERCGDGTSAVERGMLVTEFRLEYLKTKNIISVRLWPQRRCERWARGQWSVRRKKILMKLIVKTLGRAECLEIRRTWSCPTSARRVSFENFVFTASQLCNLRGNCFRRVWKSLYSEYFSVLCSGKFSPERYWLSLLEKSVYANNFIDLYKIILENYSFR